MYITLVHIEALTVIGLLLIGGSLKSATYRGLAFRFAIAATALPLIAVFAPRLLILHVVMFFLVPVLARGSRSYVAPLYLFSLMLLPNFATDVNVGSLKLWLHDIHVSLGLGALAALLMSGRRHAVRSVLDLPFAAILLLFIISEARDTSITHFLRSMATIVLTYGVPFYVVSRSVRSQEDVRRIMVALASAGTILSIILIYELLRTWPMYRMLYDHFDIPLTEGNNVKMRARFLRAAGPFIEATSAAFVLVFCFVAAWLSRSAFKSRMHHILVTGVLLAGLLPGQSRGAWLGTLICVLAVQLYRGGFAKAGKQIALFGVLGAIFLVAISVSPRIADFAGFSASGQVTVDYRQQLFQLGMEQVRQNPWTGQTSAQLIQNLSELRTGERIVDFVNTYLFFALIAGIPGALIFFLCLSSGAIALWKIPIHLRTPATAFIFAGAVAPLEMLAFTSMGGRAAIIVFVFLGLASVAARLPFDQSNVAPRRPRAPALQVATI